MTCLDSFIMALNNLISRSVVASEGSLSGMMSIYKVTSFHINGVQPTLQVKGLQNLGPKRKGPVFLLKWFGIIVFV